jgi:hypothetical protein
MKNEIRILCAAALACASLAVQAQSDAGTAPAHPWHFGIQVGDVQDHGEGNPVAQLTFGYDIDRSFGVEALANVSLLFMREGALKKDDTLYDSAVGARALASLPLGEEWKLTGGLGVVRFEDEVGDGAHNRVRQKTSPLVSVSAMYRKSHRWTFGAEVASFTSAHALSVGLRGELHF